MVVDDIERLLGESALWLSLSAVTKSPSQRGYSSVSYVTSVVRRSSLPRVLQCVLSTINEQCRIINIEVLKIKKYLLSILG